MEGQDVEGVVIAEFPSREETQNWYEGLSCQEAAQYRHRGTAYRRLIVDGVWRVRDSRLHIQHSG